MLLLKYNDNREYLKLIVLMSILIHMTVMKCSVHVVHPYTRICIWCIYFAAHACMNASDATLNSCGGDFALEHSDTQGSDEVLSEDIVCALCCMSVSDGH